ncbi:MAG: TM2 domain-containing protein [Chloroflexi bacterium]|nr:TM2 domain-containing protein [Chloroflexota bacterium]MCL5075855.1 TM2 domain-containing protein [Chloroflexota bacterium]
MQSGELTPEWRRRHVLMALSWLIGYLGADRFYQQQVGWGILKLITLGGLGLWWLVDAIVYTVQAGRS